MKETKRKDKPVVDESKLGDNLFASPERLKIEVTVWADQKEIDGKTEWVEKEFEKDPYCKVFATSDRRLEIQGLKSYAKNLLLWIIYELDPAKDYFWLNRQRYMQETGITSPTTVSLAVKELKNKYIQESNVREIYFINPHFFFSGSRINKFRDNIVRAPKKVR